MSKSDPINKNYYAAVEVVDQATDGLFYATAIFSIGSLFVEKDTPYLYDVVQISFAVCVAALFAIGLGNRLYWTPRAEDKRRQDFIAKAHGVNLSHQKTDGYYNNDLTKPVERMAAQVLENSHFTKAIALRMAQWERKKVLIYLLAWLVCVLYRRADLGLVVAASQAVFSEQILSKWFRLEWLRIRSEKIYDEVYRLFQAKAATATFQAMTLESLTNYEAAKSNAAITLSSKVFHEMNPALSAEWEEIKADLGI